MNKQDLVNDFKKIGIKNGSKIVLHSSYKAIGKLDGGPDTVIDALMEVVTQNGLIVMPTHSLCFNKNPDGNSFHDPKISPSYVGIIPEIFRKREDVLRSRHPTHSVAAWGNEAYDLIKDHEHFAATGEHSPLFKMSLINGQILLLGCNHNSNTTIHVGESITGVAYMTAHYDESWGREADYLGADGKVHTITMDEVPGCSCYFNNIEKAMENKNRQTKSKIGKADSLLMYSKDLLKTVEEELTVNPNIFINPSCNSCALAKEKMVEQGLWKEENE